MEFGLFLVTQYSLDRSINDVAGELVTQTELARDGEFDMIVTGEHHVTEENHYLLNEAVLAHIAEHIGDMRLGTGCASFRTTIRSESRSSVRRSTS